MFWRFGGLESSRNDNGRRLHRRRPQTSVTRPDVPWDRRHDALQIRDDTYDLQLAGYEEQVASELPSSLRGEREAFWDQGDLQSPFVRVVNDYPQDIGSHHGSAFRKYDDSDSLFAASRDANPFKNIQLRTIDDRDTPKGIEIADEMAADTRSTYFTTETRGRDDSGPLSALTALAGPGRSVETLQNGDNPQDIGFHRGMDQWIRRGDIQADASWMDRLPRIRSRPSSPSDNFSSGMVNSEGEEGTRVRSQGERNRNAMEDDANKLGFLKPGLRSVAGVTNKPQQLNLGNMTISRDDTMSEETKTAWRLKCALQTDRPWSEPPEESSVHMERGTKKLHVGQENTNYYDRNNSRFPTARRRMRYTHTIDEPLPTPELSPEPGSGDFLADVDFHSF